MAGNHDEVTADEVEAPGIALLDGDQRQFGGLTVGGVGGVIGDPARPMRRPEKDFVAALKTVHPDVLLLHEGPTGTTPAQRGNPALRSALERDPPSLTICGHVHWDAPIARLGPGHLINVDARAVVFTAARG